MEKHVPRRTAAGAGLLTLLLKTALFFCAALPLAAQSAAGAEPGDPQIYVLTPSPVCKADEPVVVEIAVRYHDLTAVSFVRDDLGDGVTCSESSTGRRLLSSLFSGNGESGADFHDAQVMVHTCVFRLQKYGTVQLGTSVVAVAGRLIEVALPEVRCEPPQTEPELTWIPVESRIVAGQPFRISVAAAGVPPDAVVSWSVPDGIYLEKTAAAAGCLCSFLVTPLAPGQLQYPAVTASWVADGKKRSVVSNPVSFTAPPAPDAPAEKEKPAAVTGNTDPPVIQRPAGTGKTPPPRGVAADPRLLIRCILASGLFAVLLGFAALLFKRRRLLLTVLFVCSSALCALFMVQYAAAGRYLVSASSRLYFIPDAVHGTYTEIPAGSRLRRKKTAGNWIFVRTADGKTGWIPADTVQEGAE